LTESLIRLVSENGMDWMYSNCSATAQRGALDWKPKFKKAVLPVFKDLYERVASGAETARVIRSCGGRTTKSSSVKNYPRWAIPKCGRRAKLPAHYVPSGRAKPLPPKRQLAPAAEKTTKLFFKSFYK